MDSQQQMMNDYWHIPRASLSSSAASSSAASLASSSNHSNRSSNKSNPTRIHATAKNLTFENRERNNNHNNYNNDNNKKNRGVAVNSSRSTAATAKSNSKQSSSDIHRIIYEKSSSSSSLSPSPLEMNTSTSEGKGGGKRGSSSSQGSSKSNNSTRSAASGSLLLTAANLERFAEIHKKQEKVVQKQLSKSNKNYLNGEQQHHQTKQMPMTLPLPGTNYSTNLSQALVNGHNNILGHNDSIDIGHSSKANDDHNDNNDENANYNNSDVVITMDPNLDFIKSKNLDTISIASSMHFTMVNGEGGPSKKVKRGLCDRGRQVTVLIMSMSTIFLLLIMGMVYALEMRAREMPQS